MTPATALVVKVLIYSLIPPATIGILVVQRLLRWRHIELPLLNVFLVGLLTVFAAGAIFVYFDMGQFRYGRYMNPHDLSHYYLGSKYSPEIGYFDLYNCMIIADAEGRHLFPKEEKIRRQDNYKFMAASYVFPHAQRLKKPFSEARWDDFKKDVSFFQSVMPVKSWCAILKDKGYNATPIWNGVARQLTNRFSTDSWWKMSFLVGLDIVLLAVMFLLVFAAFGWRGLLIVIIFFGTNFFMSYRMIKGGLLRLDWVALLTMTACMLKLNRPKIAGAMVAYAAAVRIFPVIFLFGMGAKCVWETIATRRIQRRYIQFFVVFLVVAAILIGLSMLDAGNVRLWREYRHKILLHNNDLSPWRVGFKYMFLWTTHIVGQWSTWEAGKVRQFQDQWAYWWLIQGVVLILCFLACRNLSDYEAFCLSFIPVYFLAAPTHYYYVMLIVPLLFFVGRMDRFSGFLGISVMFGLSLLGHALNVAYGLDLYLSFLLSCALLAFCLFMLTIAFLEWRNGDRRDDSGPDQAAAISPSVLAVIAFILGGWILFGVVAAMTPI